MTKKQSAGILLYRTQRHGLHVLLVHSGGPFWAKKDDGAWSIPKGEYEADGFVVSPEGKIRSLSEAALCDTKIERRDDRAHGGRAVSNTLV